MESSYLIVLMASVAHTYINFYKTVCFKYMLLIVCQLYFNKAEEKGRVEKIFLKERIVLKRSGYERPKVDVSEV